MNIFWQGFNELSILILIGCFILCWIYFKKLYYQTLLLRFTLISLRLITFLFLVILLSNPHFKWHENEKIVSGINLILDQSSSMAIYNDKLQHIIHSLDSISNHNNIDLSYYTHEGKKISEFAQPIINNTDFTNLSNIINSKYYDNNILISDGNINTGLNYKSISNTIDNPIHIIGVGNENNEIDIEIKNINYPKHHIEGEEFQLDFMLHSNLQSETNVTVLIENQSGIIYKKEYFLSSGSINQDYSVILENNRLENKNTISVSSEIEEKNLKNNSKDFNLEILKSKRLITFISGGLSKNSSKIKSIVDNIPRVNIEHSIRIGNRWNNKWKNENIINSKLIILDGYPTKSKDIEELNDLININIPILFISSPYDNHFTNEFLNSNYQITSKKNIENKLFKFDKNNEFFNVEKYPGQNLNYLRNCTNSILEFENGISSISTVNENLFIFVPTLTEIDLKLSNISEENLINDYIIKYINHKLNIDSQQILVTSNKKEIHFGEQVLLDININNENLDNFIESGIHLRSQNENFIEIFKSRNINNSYNFSPNNIGNYDIKAFFLNKNLDTVWSKPINISVLKLYAEQITKSLNEIGLKNLAENSGGTYSHFDNYLSLIEELNFSEENKKINKSASIIDYQKLWIIIALLLIVEWVLRKRNGLL